MIPNLILWIVSLPLDLLVFVAKLLPFAFPLWLSQGIANIMGGTGILNTFLPMFPHVGMNGLVGSLGLMTIFGWLVVLMGYLIILSLAYKFIKIIFSLASIGAGPSIGTGGK